MKKLKIFAITAQSASIVILQRFTLAAALYAINFVNFINPGNGECYLRSTPTLHADVFETNGELCEVVDENSARVI